MKKELEKVREKKQFSQLPDCVVERAFLISKDVKKTRALLRKYFGVFLTNKIIKGKFKGEEILKTHLSTRKRNYKKLYSEIFNDGNFKSVVDLGCGVNGFSYKFMPKKIKYFGIEAVGQLVELTNNYFGENVFENAKVFHGDLFNLNFVKKILKKSQKPRVVFLFQLVDALEIFEKNFSKKFLIEIAKNCDKKDKIVVSYSLKSLSGKKRFKAKRKWLLDFLNQNFVVERDFADFGERFVVLKPNNL